VRVLVLSTVFPSSTRPSFGVFVRERVRWLARRCEVEVVSPFPWFPGQRRSGVRPQPAPPACEEDDGLRVHHPRVPSLPGVGRAGDGLLYAAALLPSVARLHFPFDVIDAHFGYPDGFAAVLLGRALNRPVVISLRGYELDLARRALRRPQLAFALRRARVVAVSEPLRRLACELGAPTERVRVIGNGVDATRFQPRDRAQARARLGLPLEGTMLLCVGAYVEQKGHEEMLAILPELMARRADLFYVAVGSGGDRLPRLRARVRAAGLGARVRLEVGRPHAEIPLWLAAADLFCLASRREGSSNAVREALACGLPVVSTRVGDNAEIVRDGEDGLLAADATGPVFAAAVASALERDWDRAAIARRGAARGWEPVAAAAVEELQRACGMRPLASAAPAAPWP